ncbi:MAG: hypothetical protein ACXVB1_16755, partial [Pseudobdellovibrionaceae bacterium]
MSHQSGELEENVTSQDALYSRTSCWGGPRDPRKPSPNRHVGLFLQARWAAKQCACSEWHRTPPWG